jgi:hypothetical protein
MKKIKLPTLTFDTVKPDVFTQDYLKKLAKETIKIIHDKENKTIGIL